MLGKIYDEIVFNTVKNALFCHLVLTRLSYSVSKLKTTDYLFEHKGLLIEVERIYRHLDKLSSKQKVEIQHIGYQHILKVLNHNMCIVLPKYYGFGGEREKSIFLLKDLKKIYAEIVDL